jgi:cytochrome P450
MTWILYSKSMTTPCNVEFRAATPEEIKEHTKTKGWLSSLARFINVFAAAIFKDYRLLYQFVLKYSPDLGYFPAQVDCYFTKNPHVMQGILKHHRNDPQNGLFSHIHIAMPMYQIFSSIYPKTTANDIMLACDPEHTKTYSQFLNQFLTAKSIQGNLGDINRIVADFSTKWRNVGRPVIMNQETKLLFTAIMAQIFLGFSGPYDKISATSTNIILWAAEANISSEDKQQTINTLREAVENSLEQAALDLKPSLVKEMMEANFTAEQIQAMIITLFVAGQDKVSTSLTHVLLKLAQSKELQEKIRYEKAEPMQSPIIRALLCESLRVLCPVAGIGRTVAKPAMLTLTSPKKGHEISQLISQGGIFSCLNELAAKDPAVYSDPEKFDYTRHLYQNTFLPNLEHLPFGFGAHLCPGWYLYYAISALTVSHLVQNYKISTTFKGEPKTKQRFVTQIAEPIAISLDPHLN